MVTLRKYGQRRGRSTTHRGCSVPSTYFRDFATRRAPLRHIHSQHHVFIPSRYIHPPFYADGYAHIHRNFLILFISQIYHIYNLPYNSRCSSFSKTYSPYSRAQKSVGSPKHIESLTSRGLQYLEFFLIGF